MKFQTSINSSRRRVWSTLYSTRICRATNRSLPWLAYRKSSRKTPASFNHVMHRGLTVPALRERQPPSSSSSSSAVASLPPLRRQTSISRPISRKSSTIPVDNSNHRSYIERTANTTVNSCVGSMKRQPWHQTLRVCCGIRLGHDTCNNIIIVIWDIFTENFNCLFLW